jgi:hypothetical protein
MATRAVVEEKLKAVTDKMARAGFELDQPVEVMVDKNLPFMGYTSRDWQKHVIVVSGFAAKSPMLEGLLAHELSHVYRNITNHPSHNEKLLESVVVTFARLHDLSEDYQSDILHQAINHIQDLYADDIAIRVLTANQNKAATLDVLGEFFLGWIREEPVESNSSPKDAWLNAGMLLNNCFAVSNIQRRKVESFYEKAESLNNRFLMKIGPRARRSFGYFNHFMVNLKERVAEEEFLNQMNEYLERFWGVIISI